MIRVFEICLTPLVYVLLIFWRIHERKILGKPFSVLCDGGGQA